MVSQMRHSLDDVKAVVLRHWGYDTLRPLQEQAMASVLNGMDSLVVLPTGGGKSLCYQAPAIVRGTTTVVVSPLIALMKDQVDGLKACGIPAVQVDSSQSTSERAAIERRVREGEIRLLFVSPERLAMSDFSNLLQELRVQTFAIDEAHCISQWGHDFRTEYRQLKRIKESFPHASVHAFTATATEDVRNDIIRQLGLKNPEVLVGDFDRPNLTYRILSRREPINQVLEVVRRHESEAGIIYAISRKQVDELTRSLRKHGVNAVAYHAGLTNEERKSAQDYFASEKCNLIVATVAFGMGIDRSNVRYVMHTGMPKSLEHYQQETGRAGRDGLDSECVLLYSNADLMLWKSIMEKSASGELAADTDDGAFLETANQHLEIMSRYCRGAVCRHRALVEYFGQSYQNDSCNACDVCLNETVEVPDSTVIAQKIISCVARIKKGRFGAGHFVSILRGETTETIRKWQHEELSTFGILNTYSKTDLRDWIDQLVGLGLLGTFNVAMQSGFNFAAIVLNDESWKVMRGQRSVKLVQPMRSTKELRAKRLKIADQSWQGIDKELFEKLRATRSRIARERGWQAFMVFSDATLREMASVKPSTLSKMSRIKGIGNAKLENFGEEFLQVISDHCKF
ncbi:MAG: DNA helicase RecQ [Candidatus Melainabacteria bacterium]|nr:MAG: DNA helicase RecQ [Candidatus Melainabacteria bacterium]